MDDNKQPLGWAASPGRILNTLPCTCKTCKQPARSLLCTQCIKRLHRQEACCVQCGEMLAGPLLLTHEPASKRCGRCLSHPPDFQRTLFAYDYSGPVAELIQQFKFAEALVLSRLLADMIIDRIQDQNFPMPDALIPIPLHPSRLKQRGFNQSLELARHIGKALKTPVYHSLLIRTRATPQQSGLNRKVRERNIRGAFKIQTGKHKAQLAEKHLAIIDDVITTGSTMREAAKVLKRGGAARIHVIAVTKTRR